MQVAMRTLTLGFILAALVFGGAGNSTVSAQPPEGEGERPGSPSERNLIHGVFFPAMTSGDLLLLRDGGAFSGTLTAEAFELTPSSGPSESYAREDIAMVNVGDESDQVILTNGQVVTGRFGTDELTISLPSGSTATLAQDQISTIMFQNTPEEFMQVMRTLRSQNLFAVFAKALTTYDTVLFDNGQIMSGQIANESFTFNSPTFDTFTTPKDNVSELEIAEDADEANGDAITLKTGDRITGTLAEDSLPQFQAASVLDGEGQPSTLTLDRGEITRVVFRLPASAFGGGGRGPGIGGGPGN